MVVYPMKIILPKKFADSHIDDFIDNVYWSYIKNPQDTWIIDFSDVEWISNQELLVITAFLKYLVSAKVSFRVIFTKEGEFFEKITERHAKQLIHLWEVWKIGSILDSPNYDTYFGLGNSTIEQLKERFKYRPSSSEIYSRYGITPFVSLGIIEHYDDKKVDNYLKYVYRLNNATKEIIKRNNCDHPFVTNTLSSIITKELYENFLDHFQKSFIKSKGDLAFMSLSLKTAISNKNLSQRELQLLLERNFTEESLPEARDFYFSKETGQYYNRPVLQFSFLDFGSGIASTLRSNYELLQSEEHVLGHIDNNILRYAFQHDSSRHPIKIAFNKRDVFVPRGLFDLLSVVKRYRGLLVVRSNFGKIVYDFSNNKSIEEAFSIFGDNKKYFPGTLISIYLPSDVYYKDYDTSVIKPVLDGFAPKKGEDVHLSLISILGNLNVRKEELYDSVLSKLQDALNKQKKPSTIFLNFMGAKFELRILKKIIFYLLSSYEIGPQNSLIILNPPPIELLTDIQNELLSLDEITKNFKIHPLPCIYYDPQKRDINVYWLGVFDEEDRRKLNDLLFEQFSVSKSDFNQPYNVIGNVNYYDSFGNLLSGLPNRQQLKSLLTREIQSAQRMEVSAILERHKCISPPNDHKLFLCNGNYYQDQFIDVIHLLNDEIDGQLICQILYNHLELELGDLQQFSIISITATSQKIVSNLIQSGLISEKQTFYASNYLSFSKEDTLANIPKGSKCILVCDVVATGYLTRRIDDLLKLKGSDLVQVAVIIDAIEDSFESSGEFRQNYKDRIRALYQMPIKKYRREHPYIREAFGKKELIRINPFTNIPITQRISGTFEESVLMQNDQLLSFIDPAFIKVGYLKYNNLIHPYFFDTKAILRAINPSLLSILFTKIKFQVGKVVVLYPKGSGVGAIDFNLFRTVAFSDHSVQIAELERFNTPEGWKFPHTTEAFSSLVNGKNIMIFDDGSCSGDSLIQMLDEITLFNIKEVVLLSLIGRVSAHKREFFSRISRLKTVAGKEVEAKVYFGSHWNIPTYYLDDNPNSRERRWLNELISLQNTPEKIRSIAKIVFDATTPKDEEFFNDYKYLPRERNSGEIPKHDLIRLRNEIGKVTGFRFYVESFNYFNNLIQLYEGSTRENRYMEMELLCGCLIFEPYLYKLIGEVLPDIVDKIEEFIEALIWGNPKRNNRKIDIATDLTYKWDKKDILHLFFIVFEGEEMLERLSSVGKLEALFQFVLNEGISFSYFLYKLLSYFPLSRDEVTTKDFSSRFIHIIDVWIQENYIPENFYADLKIFRSFISTFPSDGEYFAKVNEISDFYRKLGDGRNHKDSLLIPFDNMLVDLEVMAIDFDKADRGSFIISWNQLNAFIERMLSFAKTFPGFFLTNYSLLEGDSEFSLRSIHGKLNELINNINKESDFAQIEMLLTTFQIFLDFNSDINGIFSHLTTKNPVDEVLRAMESGGIEKNEIEFAASISSNIVVDCPFFFFKEVIIKEIVLNLRHRDKSASIRLEFIIRDGFFVLFIVNKISVEQKHGGGHGLNLLGNVNQFPYEIMRYCNNRKSGEEYFKQEFKIKLAMS